MTTTYSVDVRCDCSCENCEPGACEIMATHVQNEGSDGVYGYEEHESWYNVDPSPDDGDGEHYCPPCGKALNNSEDHR